VDVGRTAADRVTYDRRYYEELRPADGLARLVDDARDALVARIVGRGAQGSVLDVGCGRGDLLARMDGFDRSGIEISEDGLTLARARLPDATLAAGDIQDGSPLPGPFDAVTAINVLEHLDRPQDGIAALAAVQRAGALLVVHLPVIGTATQRRIYAGGYDSDPTHVWRPSGPGARATIEAAGYRHVRSAYAPFVPMGLFRHVPVHPAWLGVFRRR
jgi:SAM-dependent methyltransferase